jgi:hypothetical protein
MNIWLPGLQNDMRGCPPCIWVPFDNRDGASDSSPTDLKVYTGDENEHIVPLTAGSVTSGIWGVDGYFTPNRDSGGIFGATAANAPVWRARHLDTASSALGQYARDILRLDDLDVNDGMLFLIAAKHDASGSPPTLGVIFEYEWRDSAGNSVGRITLRTPTGSNATSLVITEPGGTQDVNSIGSNPSAGSLYCHSFLLMKTGAASYSVYRAINDSGDSSANHTVTTFPGSGDTPSSTESGVGICGPAGTETGSKMNIANGSGDCHEISLRSLFIARCGPSVFDLWSSIHTQFYARKGAVPFDLLRGL